VKENGIDLKINTVVTRFNLDEDFSALKEIAPKRWKILKMQPFKDRTFDNSALGINDEEFAGFCRRQKELGIGFIPEDTTQNAYIFVDPAGNLVDNTGGNNTPAGNLLKENFARCLEKLPFDEALYNSRYIAG
jgi:MoaA/NifB/PqqE/SkfB family radical SAM enzyme